MGAGKVLLGVLAGVAVGATLGILFAPDKGSVTRRKISKKGDDYAEEVEERFNQFIESISKQFKTMTEETMRMVESEKHEIEEGIAGAPSSK